MTVTLDMPGGFDSFFSGSGVGQGQTDGQAAMEALWAAYRDARRIKRARGYTLRLTLPRDRDVIELLREYGGYCLDANQDDPNYAEISGARAVIQRCDALLAQLTTDGEEKTDG